MKFFITDNNINEESRAITIDGQDAFHIAKVLRCKEGGKITAVDSSMREHLCTIAEIKMEHGQQVVILNIHQVLENDTEPLVKVTLFQAMPKADKMDLIIEKCVELGVYEIYPVITRYTVVKLKDKAEDKCRRFNKISESAAKQSGRGIIPAVHMPVSFDEALLKLKEADISLFAYENEKKSKIKHALSGFSGKTASIFIGPEGGFSMEEAEALCKNNVVPVSLGKRILRTETAGFTSLTVLLNELEEL